MTNQKKSRGSTTVVAAALALNPIKDGEAKALWLRDAKGGDMKTAIAGIETPDHTI